MKKFSIILYLIGLYSCSPKISEHFETNHFIKSHGYSIYNDDLQLFLYTPGDINYCTNRNELNKILNKKFKKIKDSVLIYGIADDPMYEFVISIKSIKQSKKYNKFIYLDTTVNGRNFNFIGIPTSENSKIALEIDLKNIFNSFYIGKDYKKDTIKIWDISKKFYNSNKFFNALNEIKQFPTYSKQDDWNKLQLELTYASFLGENQYYKENLKKLESKFIPNDTITNIINHNKILNSQQSLQKLIDESKKSNLVMINENHFFPNHRLLVYYLLDSLKNIGFDYLALETLNEKQDSLINSKEFSINTETGFYLREQNYSNLVRKARELGFNLISYENTNDKKERELGQAENLYSKTFLINSKAKVIVLVGLAHLEESQNPNDKKRMAAFFKEKYNINPLTISQTHFNLYRNLSNEKYTVFESGLFGDKYSNLFDYVVLNNNDYLKSNISQIEYINKHNEDVQVMLFYNNELDNYQDYNKLVPFYTTILKSGEKKYLPIFKKENIMLRTYDKYSNLIDKKMITLANTM